MRSFNANFITEKNKRADGPAPINLITFGFAAPAYICDRDITPPGGSLHKGLVKSWGFIDTSITQTPGRGILGSIEIADLQLTMINTESPRFSDSFTDADPPENVTVTLYQWFNGLQYSEKELIFKGQIYGQPKYDEYTCTLTIRGIFDKYNRTIGSDLIITADAYPDADPDDIGKMMNIVYGNVPQVPCRAIESGSADSLVAAITAVQTTIELSDATYFANSGIIGIDAEQISYTGKSTNTLTGCTRGYNSTTATNHDAGAPVWEELSRFVYMIAGHPVKAIGDIYVDGVRITAVCTKYTGQAGNILTGYTGRAVFTVPSRLTRQQAIDLLLSDTIGVNDAIAIVDTIGVTDGISVSDTIWVVDAIGVDTGSHGHPASANEIVVWEFRAATPHGTYVNYAPNITDGSLSTGAVWTNGGESNYITVSKAFYESFKGEPQAYRACIMTGDLGGGTARIGNTLVSCGTNWTVKRGNWIDTSASWATINTWTFNVYLPNNSPSGSIIEVWLEIGYMPTVDAHAADGVAKTGSASKSGMATKSGTVTKSGSASKSGAVTRTGAVTLSGNSVADVRIGEVVTANVQGYQDDALGAYTGTAAALIERPDHVFKHLWAVQMVAPLADIDTTTFTAAGVFYAAKAYKFAMLINAPVAASDLLMRLALQCRSRFMVTAWGKAKLFVSKLAQTSGHAIPKNEIKFNSMSIERSPTTEIINRFSIYYELDLTQAAGNPQSYWSAINYSNAASIARYGTREWKGLQDLFCFNAVRDEAMAQDVGAFLQEYHAKVRRMPHFGVFLDNMEIEPGDIIDVTHPLDAMSNFVVEVQKILHHIGSKSQVDYLEITGVENGA
jgi:hypothetical protein